MFALRYPLCDRIVALNPDITEPDPRRKVWDFNSPIALFVSKPQLDEGAHSSDEPISPVEDEAMGSGGNRKLQAGSVNKKQFPEGNEQSEDKQVNGTEQGKTFKQKKPVNQKVLQGYEKRRELRPVAIQMNYPPSMVFFNNIYLLSCSKILFILQFLIVKTLLCSSTTVLMYVILKVNNNYRNVFITTKSQFISNKIVWY